MYFLGYISCDIFYSFLTLDFHTFFISMTFMLFSAFCTVMRITFLFTHVNVRFSTFFTKFNISHFTWRTKNYSKWCHGADVFRLARAAAPWRWPVARVAWRRGVAYRSAKLAQSDKTAKKSMRYFYACVSICASVSCKTAHFAARNGPF